MGKTITISFTLLLLIFSCKLPQQEANLKLHHAVLTNEPKAVQKYLKKGASVDYREAKRGWTPLLFAIEDGNSEIVKLLIDQGADVNIVSTMNNVSPLQRAAAKGDLDIVKMLVRQGADIDHQDAKLRSTPLMWATVNGHINTARYLLENDALFNVRGNRGESALFLAVSTEQIDMVALLVSYNAITDRPDIYGNTPLQKAKELKNIKIINLLNNAP